MLASRSSGQCDPDAPTPTVGDGGFELVRLCPDPEPWLDLDLPDLEVEGSVSMGGAEEIRWEGRKSAKVLLGGGGA